MVRRDVQELEVVEITLYLPAAYYLEAHLCEDAIDLAQGASSQVQPALGRRVSRKSDIQSLLGDGTGQIVCLQGFLSRSICLF